MKPQTYEMLAVREGTYWWHVARRRMAIALLRKYGIVDTPRWLDLGCGPGGNLELLDALSPALVVGTDISPNAWQLARQRAPHASIVGADISQSLPYADSVFDVVTIFNVLYHSWIKDEVTVLSNASRVMRRGGLLLVTEPAFPALARPMDHIGMASRRYRRKQFAQLCTKAGFDILYSGYFTSFGFPLLYALGALHRSHDDTDEPLKTADMKPLPAAANKLMYAMARAEGRMIEWGCSVPFGTTLVCVARKPAATVASRASSILSSR